MERLRIAGDRTVKTTVELVTAFPLFVRGKRTGEFLYSGAYLGGPDNAQARGTCIRG